MINAIPSLRQNMINAITCLRQKSQKTYPGWPHVPTKPLSLMREYPPPPPGVETSSTKNNYIFNTTQCNWPSDMQSAPLFSVPCQITSIATHFLQYIWPILLIFSHLYETVILLFPLSLAAHKTHIELTNKCYVAQIYGFH